MGIFEKGKPPPKHKEGCKCFRCTRIPWTLGKHHSTETKRKISQTKMGTPSPKKGIPLGFIPKMAFKKNDPRLMGSSHPRWAGDNLGYGAWHM